MKIIAVDPGYDRLGVAILEKENGKETLLFSQCYQTSKEDSFSKRLKFIGDALDSLIKEYSPDVFASEGLFFSKNQKTAIDVAGSRGALFYVAEKHNLPLHEYSPLEIKVAVTGYGKSDKTQVTEMVKRLVRIEKKNALDDEYDAIAVALTCSAIEKY